MSIKLDFFIKNKIPKRAQKIMKEKLKDNEGNIVLRKGRYAITSETVNKFKFSNSWVFIYQPGAVEREEIPGKLALVKSYVADKCPEYYEGTDAEMTTANNFILPEIAKQFGVKTAEYYNVIFEDDDELRKEDNYIRIDEFEKQKILPNKKYLLTKSFVKQNEKLIHLADVLEQSTELNVSKMLSDIENYLKKRLVSKADIERVKNDFIKQSIFNKFIGYSDEHNLNSAIIVSVGSSSYRARLAPSYDLDFAAGVYNMINGGIQPIAFFRKSDDGKFDLSSMLNQFKGDFEKEYLKEIIPQINIKEAIENGQKYGNIELSEKAKNRYEKFFEKQIKDLNAFYNKTYEEKNQEEER